MEDFEENDNGFKRCAGDYCLKLEKWKDASGPSCGNDVIDADEYCDGHVACDSTCQNPKNTTAYPATIGGLVWKSCSLVRGQKASCTTCGNGILDDTTQDEECDDALPIPSYPFIGCLNCKISTTCKDNKQEGPEICDETNSKGEFCC